MATPGAFQSFRNYPGMTAMQPTSVAAPAPTAEALPWLPRGLRDHSRCEEQGGREEKADFMKSVFPGFAVLPL
jgi:hypothetical protein